MCCGFFPTCVRLRDKGVHCPLNRVIYEGPHEDLHHVFFDCSFALQVWLRVGLWDKVQCACTHSNSVVDSIFTLLQVLSREESQQFAALLWSLWKHSNLKLWQGVSKIVAHVVDRAIHLVKDWIMVTFLTWKHIAAISYWTTQVCIPPLQLCVAMNSDDIRLWSLFRGSDHIEVELSVMLMPLSRMSWA
jgi:hypothetical protein